MKKDCIRFCKIMANLLFFSSQDDNPNYLKLGTWYHFVLTAEIDRQQINCSCQRHSKKEEKNICWWSWWQALPCQSFQTVATTTSTWKRARAVWLVSKWKPQKAGKKKPLNPRWVRMMLPYRTAIGDGSAIELLFYPDPRMGHGLLCTKDFSLFDRNSYHARRARVGELVEFQIVVIW